MFRFKQLNIITLFHRPTLPASIRVHTLLKQASAAATQYATEDQASGHTDQTNEGLEPFELDISEQAPTSDQLRNILQYVGANNAGRVIKGSKNDTDALTKLRENPEAFQRPVIVDWNNGRAVVGDDESEILNMLRTLPKQ